MRNYFQRYHLCLVLALLASFAATGQNEPIKLFAENPHYLYYRGKPLILLSSGEHYGALLNLDFNYEEYFATLQAQGLNMTRTFTGSYVEPQGAFNIAENTLAPKANRFICPWARSGIPGYANGGNKFDLDQWDTSYFTRLSNLVSSARKNGIIVELTLFCPFYEEAQWSLSPMNPDNNINHTPAIDRNDVYTLHAGNPLLVVEERLVRKIVSELKDADNVIFEICNEPYFGGVTEEWQRHIADVITSTEQNFRFPHLISQNIANGDAIINDPFPTVSVFNFHYASPPLAVTENYHLNRVIGNNETGFKGTEDSIYRRQAWEFILAGGGLFNNLDYSFTAGRERGTFNYPSTQPGGGSESLRQQFSYLAKFINRFHFAQMKPDTSVSLQAREGFANCHMLSQKGSQYALYIAGGKQVSIHLDIPGGRYKVSWFDPLTGKTLKTEEIEVPNDGVELQSPNYSFDIALAMILIEG